MTLDTLTWLQQNLAQHYLACFVPIYILGGRPAAILSAQLLGFKAFFLLPAVVLLDIVQIPLFYSLYRRAARTAEAKGLTARFRKRAERLRSSRFFGWIRVMGTPGVVAITMTPFKGCGMWSGVLLAEILQLPKSTSYPLLILGSLLGSVLIYFAGRIGFSMAGLN